MAHRPGHLGLTSGVHVTRRQLVTFGAPALLVVVVALLLAFQVGLFGSPAPSASITISPSPSESAAPSAEPSIGQSPTPESAVCPLSGLAADVAIEEPALIVSIDNHPAARPASGLNSADLVVEAPVEGNTTRFAAYYLCQSVSFRVGPVRSLRDYHKELWLDTHAFVIGFGAGREVRQRFRDAGMPFVDGNTENLPWFERRATRRAPHNVYLSLDAARQAIGGDARLESRAAAVGSLRPPFDFGALATDLGVPVTMVTIRTSPAWVFGWDWDAASSSWHRRDAGQSTVDAESNQPVSARTVIVQRVRQTILSNELDYSGSPRKLQHLVGQGQGTAYVDGRAVPLTWSRPSADAGTTWTIVETGESLVLPPGRVWWEIVDVAATVTQS
jgi:hypothetical protein